MGKVLQKEITISILDETIKKSNIEKNIKKLEEENKEMENYAISLSSYITNEEENFRKTKNKNIGKIDDLILGLIVDLLVMAFGIFVFVSYFFLPNTFLTRAMCFLSFFFTIGAILMFIGICYEIVKNKNEIKKSFACLVNARDMHKEQMRECRKEIEKNKNIIETLKGLL